MSLKLYDTFKDIYSRSRCAEKYPFYGSFGNCADLSFFIWDFDLISVQLVRVDCNENVTNITNYTLVDLSYIVAHDAEGRKYTYIYCVPYTPADEIVFLVINGLINGTVGVTYYTDYLYQSDGISAPVYAVGSRFNCCAERQRVLISGGGRQYDCYSPYTEKSSEYGLIYGGYDFLQNRYWGVPYDVIATSLPVGSAPLQYKGKQWLYGNVAVLPQRFEIEMFNDCTPLRSKQYRQFRIVADNVPLYEKESIETILGGGEVILLYDNQHYQCFLKTQQPFTLKKRYDTCNCAYLLDMILEGCPCVVQNNCAPLPQPCAVEITQDCICPQLIVSAAVIDDANAPNGYYLSITTSGGVAPYNYYLTDTATNTVYPYDPLNLPPNGNYLISATDAVGCTGQTLLSLEEICCQIMPLREIFFDTLEIAGTQIVIQIGQTQYVYVTPSSSLTWGVTSAAKRAFFVNLLNTSGLFSGTWSDATPVCGNEGDLQYCSAAENGMIVMFTTSATLTIATFLNELVTCPTPQIDNCLDCSNLLLSNFLATGATFTQVSSHVYNVEYCKQDGFTLFEPAGYAMQWTIRNGNATDVLNGTGNMVIPPNSGYGTPPTGRISIVVSNAQGCVYYYFVNILNDNSC